MLAWCRDRQFTKSLSFCIVRIVDVLILIIPVDEIQIILSGLVKLDWSVIAILILLNFLHGLVIVVHGTWADLCFF